MRRKALAELYDVSGIDPRLGAVLSRHSCGHGVKSRKLVNFGRLLHMESAWIFATETCDGKLSSSSTIPCKNCQGSPLRLIDFEAAPVGNARSMELAWVLTTKDARDAGGAGRSRVAARKEQLPSWGPEEKCSSPGSREGSCTSAKEDGRPCSRGAGREVQLPSPRGL